MNILATDANRGKEMLDNFDWYFVPVLNPDGYEYSHVSDRVWRKTRSRSSSSSCRGVDPNRNYNYPFGGEGTSSNPCSGKSRFSKDPKTNLFMNI